MALSPVVIHLLKGVLYQEDQPQLWASLLELQSQVRDYLRVLGLEVILDEAEGYAFLKARKADDDEPELPRLVSRRPLSYPVSLLLALLRKKLAEFDALGGSTRLILTRDEVALMMSTYLPAGSNEARRTDQIESYLNKAVDLGFVRRLKGQEQTFEVRRILKAYIDAQWLADFDSQLAAYAAHARG